MAFFKTTLDSDAAPNAAWARRAGGISYLPRCGWLASGFVKLRDLATRWTRVADMVVERSGQHNSGRRRGSSTHCRHMQQAAQAYMRRWGQRRDRAEGELGSIRSHPIGSGDHRGSLFVFGRSPSLCVTTTFYLTDCVNTI